MVYLIEMCDNIVHDTPVIGAWLGGDLWKVEYGPFSSQKKLMEALREKIQERLREGYSLHSWELFNHSDRTRIEYFIQEKRDSTRRTKIENLEGVMEDDR